MRYTPSALRLHRSSHPSHSPALCLSNLPQREREVERDDRKRGYNSLAGQDVDVTPEEMEAYR